MGTITWGAWAGYVRLGIRVDGSGTTRNIILLVGWDGGVNFSNTISRGGSWAGSKTCSLNKPWGSTGEASHYAVSQTWTGTRTYTASFPTPWGTASVSRSVTNTAPPAPSVPKPGAPSNFKASLSGSTATLTFTKGSNAASTQIQAETPSKAWHNVANPTGTSATVSGVAANSRIVFRLYSKNSAGNSATIGPYYVYTKPTAPTVPKVAGQTVSWTLPSLFKHGVELQRTDNGGSTVTTTTLGAVTTYTDSATWVPSTQYRVRCWAGPSHDQAKTYSDWSAWSKTWMTANYAPPKITKFTVARCNSAGELTEMGTYLRCTYSGSTVSVKDGDTETNWMSRRVKWRKKGTETWTKATLLNKGAPGAFTNLKATQGAGAISVTEVFEVAFELEDAYSGTVQIVTVPVAQVAFSIAERGVGVGKTWERGALDVAGDAHISGNINAGGDVRIEGSLTVGKPDVITITGSFSFTPPAAGSAVSGSQSFGQVFAGLPVVMLTPASGRIGVSVTERSAKAFSWDLRNDSGGPLPVGSELCYWMAVGTPA